MWATRSKATIAAIKRAAAGLRRGARKVGDTISAAAKHTWRGELDEREKPVLRQGLWRSLLRCWAHFVTLIAIVVLAWLNIAGYFVGAQFQGCTTVNCQTLDRLGLQVASKILELLVITSLGTILLDIVRHELLLQERGLPLGLLFSQQAFKDLSYLVSPEFRFGIGAISPWYKLLAYALFIVTATLISVTVGPSAALLLIPEVQSSWPAGGASFWMTGTADDLWPSTLNSSTSGGVHCLSPNQDAILGADLSYYGCPWAGLSSLQAILKDDHYSPIDTLTILDGILPRQYDTRFKGVDAETWVTGIDIATGLLAKNVGQEWFQALLSIPQSSYYHTFRWRSQGGTSASVSGWAPAVRVSCLNSTFTSNVTDLRGYPYLPEYGAYNGENMMVNTKLTTVSGLDTYWIEVPETARLSDNTTTTDMPSALLAIITNEAAEDSNTTGTVFTCSIDARWASVVYRGTPIDSFDQHFTVSATWSKSTTYPQNYTGWSHSFLPVSGGSFRKVAMELDWLQIFNPQWVQGEEGSTALAALFQDQSIGSMVTTTPSNMPMLEMDLATMIADGMSRTSFALTGFTQNNLTGPLALLTSNPNTDWLPLLKGSFKYPLPSGNSLKFDLSVTVSGYAYFASTNAYRLALSVLFLHAALVLAHLVYVVRARKSSTTWQSLTNLLVLAAVSGTSQDSTSAVASTNPANTATMLRLEDRRSIFRNGSSGITRYRTMSTAVKIRTRRFGPPKNEADAPSTSSASSVPNPLDGDGDGDRSIEMIFGHAKEHNLEGEGYKKVAAEKKYR